MIGPPGRQFRIIYSDFRGIIAFGLGDRIFFLGQWSCLRLSSDL